MYAYYVCEKMHIRKTHSINSHDALYFIQCFLLGLYVNVCVCVCVYQQTCSRVYNREPRGQSSYWFLIPAEPLELCKLEVLKTCNCREISKHKKILKEDISTTKIECFDVEF